jgi:hypothetical protein
MTTVIKPALGSQPQRREQPQARRRNAYDCDGEYELPIARHWIAATSNSTKPRVIDRIVQTEGHSDIQSVMTVTNSPIRL